MPNLRSARLVTALIIVCVLSACSSSAGRVVPLESQTTSLDPSLPDSLTLSDIRPCLRTAAIRRGWRVLSFDDSDAIPMQLNVRTHEVSIDVHFDNGELRAEYRDSRNLLYDEEGEIREVVSYDTATEYRGPVIHRNYDRWIDMLLEDMAREVLAQGGQCA